MTEVRKRKPFVRTPAHAAAISAALKGRTYTPKFERVCACGIAFKTAASNAKFCSRKCNRAARGHGIRHAPEFAHFPKRCAICSSTNHLVGDHNHATGAARGILCRNCNLAIGHMHDNPEKLRAAALYLENL